MLSRLLVVPSRLSILAVLREGQAISLGCRTDPYLRQFLLLTHISPFWRIYESNDTYHMSSQGYTTDFLLFALISFVISIALGAGFGTLGGLIGKALNKPKMGVSIPSQQGLPLALPS